MKPSSTRRRLLASLPALATGAGCIGAGSAPGSASDEAATETPTATATRTDTPTDSPTETETETETTDTPDEALEAWLADANGYDGSVRRYAPDHSPSVWVGEHPEKGEPYHSFEPAAIEVAPGTTVYWEWTGHGGEHNVVAVDDSFASGDPVEANPGTIFEYTFEETGTYRYVCETHEDEGMKGAVVVKEPPSTGYSALDDWLIDAANWDGTLTDDTGVDATTITAGSEMVDGSFAFDPPALKVSTGTTVSWKWTGEGGGHNVVFEDADLGLSEIYTDPGVHHEYTFQETGVYRYACEPHQAIGMKGAIVVE